MAKLSARGAYEVARAKNVNGNIYVLRSDNRVLWRIPEGQYKVFGAFKTREDGIAFLAKRGNVIYAVLHPREK